MNAYEIGVVLLLFANFLTAYLGYTVGRADEARRNTIAEAKRLSRGNR